MRRLSWIGQRRWFWGLWSDSTCLPPVWSLPYAYVRSVRDGLGATFVTVSYNASASARVWAQRVRDASNGRLQLPKLDRKCGFAYGNSWSRCL